MIKKVNISKDVDENFFETKFNKRDILLREISYYNSVFNRFGIFNDRHVKGHFA